MSQKKPLVIDLNKVTDGVWFDYQDAARFKVRQSTLDFETQLRKQTIVKKREFKNGFVYQYEDVDEEKRTELTIDYCLVDWDGLVDAEGKKIPCIKENKLKIMAYEGIGQFVLDCIAKLKAGQQEAEENELKN